MVYDRIENLNKYIDSDDYNLIKSVFLDFVSPDMEERKYEIDCDRIYAKVMSYNTKDPDICKLESHYKYIDIQCTITGAEGIDVYKRESLEISESYNSDKDVIFYEKNEEALVAHTNNVEGYFTFLKPEEVHSPQQRVMDIERVKKFVIKYSVDSF